MSVGATGSFYAEAVHRSSGCTDRSLPLGASNSGTVAVVAAAVVVVLVVVVRRALRYRGGR